MSEHDPNADPLEPPVPAQPLVDPQVEANDPNAPVVAPDGDLSTPDDARREGYADPAPGEELQGEGGEEGAEKYDGGEIPRTGDETFRSEDADPLNDDLDR